MDRIHKLLFTTAIICWSLLILGAGNQAAKGQADDQIYYISCLHNGVGPDIDLTPFAITDADTLQRSTIPVGSWVVRVTDGDGNLMAPDAKGRVLIFWNEKQWWIVPQALKKAGPDGSTDCDGHIDPVPTLTQPAPPLAPTLLTVTPLPAEQPTATPRPSNPSGMPVYDPGRFAVPGIQSVFKDQPPAVVGSYRIYNFSSMDIVPQDAEQCIDTSLPADLDKCDTPGQGIAVYSPVAGCAFRLADNPSIVVIVINCERDVQFQKADGTSFKARREIVLSLLDPKTTVRITSTGTNVKPGYFIGSLCTDSNKADCGIAKDTPIHLSIQLRLTNFNEADPATNDELLGFLATPNCLFDAFLYSPGNPKPNPNPLQACPAS